MSVHSVGAGCFWLLWAGAGAAWKKKTGAGAGAGWGKNQEPEPREKKVRSRSQSRSRSRKKICRLPSPEKKSWNFLRVGAGSAFPRSGSRSKRYGSTIHNTAGKMKEWNTCPSWPNSLFPQDQAVPSSSTMTTWQASGEELTCFTRNSFILRRKPRSKDVDKSLKSEYLTRTCLLFWYLL